MAKYIIEKGLIVGAFHIVFTLLLYLMGVEYLVNVWMGILSFVISVALLLFFGMHYRKLNGGYLLFKDAFVFFFFLLAISSLLSTVFTIVLYHLIDPELPQVVSDALVQKTIGFMERFNAPQEDIDEVIEKMESNPDQFSIPSLLMGYFWSLIIGTIIALILAAIIKKNPPVFQNNAENL